MEASVTFSYDENGGGEIGEMFLKVWQKQEVRSLFQSTTFCILLEPQSDSVNCTIEGVANDWETLIKTTYSI